MLNQKGQALVEYILIIAVVSALLIGVVNIFGGYLKDKITETSCSLVDEVYVGHNTDASINVGEAKCVPEGSISQ